MVMGSPGNYRTTKYVCKVYTMHYMYKGPYCALQSGVIVVYSTISIINPLHTCAVRITVLGLVSVCVCLLVLIYHLEQLRVQY